MLVCDAASSASVALYVERLSMFLSQFSWLTDSFVLEFFTESHWEKLPKSWRAVVNDVHDFDELANWMSFTQPMVWNPGKVVWPLSLQALRSTVRVYSLPRRPSDDSAAAVADCIKRISRDFARPSTSRLNNSQRWKSVDEQLTAGRTDNNSNDVVKSFRRCIKAKKLHEIARLAHVVNMVMERCGTKLVVDVGSGHGHLSRLLTFGFGLRLVSVEADGTHVMDAQRLDNKVVSDIKKRNRQCSPGDARHPDKNCSEEISSTPPKHLVYKIDASVTSKEFLEVLSQACHYSTSRAENEEDGGGSPAFAQIGLHTCGNLAQTMLRVHAECAQSVAIVSVACCYMKLGDDPRSMTSHPNLGYPISQFASSLSGCHLSYEAKELACHAIELYIQRLRNNSRSLKIHCYRATLETLITRHNPLMKRLGLRSVKCSEELSFIEYARQAMQSVSVEVSSDDLRSDEVDAKMSQWKRVIVFYSLRLVLAPIVETLILLDRCLFLWEKGHPSCIAPIFEPTLSPRNHVLISVKSALL